MVEPIASAIATKVLSDGLSKLATNLLDATGGKLHSLLTTHGSSLRSHLDRTFERCTKIKTLLYRDEPTNLLDLYINVKFKCENQIVNDYGLIEQIRTRKKVIITGTGGSGKSIFMKYLWVSLFENSQGKIPVFVELRTINESTPNDWMIIFTNRSWIPRPLCHKSTLIRQSEPAHSYSFSMASTK